MNRDEINKAFDEEYIKYRSAPRTEFGDTSAAYMVGVQDGKKQREWVGLTDEEANQLWESTDSDWELIKRTEAKLRSKNT